MIIATDAQPDPASGRDRRADFPRDVLDNLLEGCQVIGPDFRYLYVNRTVVRHGRTSAEKLIGRTMMDAYPGIEQTAMFADLKQCMEDHAPRRMENEFAYPDGAKAWFELRFEPVPEGVVILSVDITDRKRAEFALKRSTRALAALSKCNQTLVRATAEHRFVQDVCKVLIEQCGYGLAWIGLREGEDGRTVRPVAHVVAGGGTAVLTPVRWDETGHGAGITGRAIESGRSAVVHYASPAAEHEPDRQFAAAHGYASGIALPIVDQGNAIGALTIYASETEVFDGDERALLDEVAMDLGYGISTLRARTEQKKTEEQLRIAQRLEAVGLLAGGVAHDFNNLLSVITGYTGFALNALHEPDPMRADLVEVQNAAQRAAALTRQLLAFSRKQVLEPEVLSLNKVVGGIEGMLRRLLGEDIDIVVRLADGLGSVEADPGQIEQVIMNLAVNARDAMPQGGKLTIETSNVELDRLYADQHYATKAGRYVLLAVSDTGFGMDAETRSRIFEPFFTTKEKGKGTGLGLSTVYGIVKQSGGSIEVYSEPGHGTSFKVYLPRVDAPAVETRHKQPAAVATGHETILVVEDEDAVRRLAERILKAAGYCVLTAANGGEALLICERQPGGIDVLLTDVVMPQMSGRDLAQRLAGLAPGIKVLFTSGYTDDAIVRHGVLEPGTRFIAKPYSAADLTRKVREALDEDGGPRGVNECPEKP